MRLRKSQEQTVAKQLREALAAKEQAEASAEEVEKQVGFLKGLQVRWDRVHERNNLAHLFDKEWRATN